MRRWVSLTGLARVCFFTAFITSTGCSWIYGEDGLFPDNTARYQEAPELAVITVPPSAGTGDAAIDPTYPIPEVSENFRLESEFGVPRPTPLTSASQYETVRIQRLGDESWALVAVAPGQLWPQVRAFLTASGIGVAASDAQAGLIDTQFVELKERPLSTRFRFRVDSGVQRNTAELHVLQQNQAVDNSSWPESSDDLELEQEMLRNVAQFIANSAESAPISMMADRAMSAAGRISLEDTESYTRLRLVLPFNRAWASVNKALPEAGFAIDDKNRSEGVFYVTFVGQQEDDDGGWFDWMWGGEDEHPLANKQYMVKLASLSEDEMLISLFGTEGGQIPRRDQQALLTLIKGSIN
jgi:outer membrane protein assembly factor BamC